MAELAETRKIEFSDLERAQVHAWLDVLLKLADVVGVRARVYRVLDRRRAVS